MTHTADTTNPATSRRNLLRVGTVGLGAAFLAACSKEGPKAGQSGAPAATTTTPPTPPEEKITSAERVNDNVMLKTGSSLELLVAKAYDDNAKRITSAEWTTEAARMMADHESTATLFSDAVKGNDPRTTKPNEYLQTNLVDPAAGSLVDEATTLTFLASLESMLAATYVSAAGTFTTAEWRQKVMTAGAAAARRAAVLGNGGTGQAPTAPIYPLLDLIPSKAMLTASDTADTGS